MAGISGSENEKADSWRRLGDADKLDLEKVLLKLGLHVDSHLLSVTEVTLHHLPTNILDDDDLRCLFLAVVGRGSFQTKSLDLTSRRYNRLTEDNAEALCMNLRSNRNVQSLYLNYQDVFGTPRGCTLMADALKAESAIEKLTLCNNYMSAEAVKNLMDGLQEGKGKTLKYLSLSCNDIFDEGVESVANMLETNTSLKHLEMHATSAGFLGAERMSHALAINSTLEHLSFGYNRIGQKGMEALLTALVYTADAGPKNKTLKELVLNDMKAKDLAVDSLASMIRSNDTLHHLRLEGARLQSKDWVEKIIPALQQNATLKELNLSDARGLDSGVFVALMGLVSSSSSKTVLENIILDHTVLFMRAAVINEELRINMDYRIKLREAEAKYLSGLGPEIAREESKTTDGRLVFCGSEFAGKSTIFKTMITIAQERQPKEATWKLKEAWVKAKKKLRAINIRKRISGKDVIDLSERTRGIDVETLSKEPNRVMLWDFAGQQEYHALHDYVFPNVKNSCFLYVCSPTFPPSDPRKGGKFREQEDMREDFKYWMKFIASNSKRVQQKEGNAGLPRVTFVLTFKDKLSSIGKLDAFKVWAEEIVDDLQKEFYGVITLCDTVEVVNAHDNVDVGNLQIVMLRSLNELLANSTEIAAAACNVVRRALVQWAKNNNNEPILRFEVFKTQCDEELHRTVRKVPRIHADSDAQAEAVDSKHNIEFILSTDVGKKFVLAYLSDVGEVIFHEGMDFLIVNLKWFGVKILGNLVDLFETRAAEQAKVLVYCKRLLGYIFQRASALKHDQGFFKEDDIKKFLGTNLKSLMSSDQMLNMLKHLDMCFQAPHSKVFVPAVLVNKRDKATTSKHKLSWTLPNESAGVESESFIYVGRRLECENQSQAFITPAIFPRMQVSMRNYLDGRESSKEGIIIERNLIYFAHGQYIKDKKKRELEVWVEYSGDDCVHSYVDVLACSSMAFEETLQFMEVNVVSKFNEICASPQGCPGVVLVQAAISPTCVKNIDKYGDRKKYAFRLLDLQDRLDTDETYQHFWSENQSAQGTESSRGAPIISDFGLDLLQGEGALNRLLSKKVHAKLAHHVQQQHVPQMRNATSTASTSQLPPIDPAVQKSAPLPYEIPTLYINLEDPDPGTFLKKLMARLILPDEKIQLRIHLMCSGAHGSHVVKGQKGQILNLTFKDGSLLMKYAAAGIIVGGAKSFSKQFSAADSRCTINVKLLDKLINDLFVNTGQELQVDTMHLLGDLSDVDIKDSLELSDVELLTLMVNCYDDEPCDQSWLDSVLNVFNVQDKNFREDFELQKVEYLASKYPELETPVGWLCHEHYELGIAQNICKGSS